MQQLLNLKEQLFGSDADDLDEVIKAFAEKELDVLGTAFAALQGNIRDAAQTLAQSVAEQSISKLINLNKAADILGYELNWLDSVLKADNISLIGPDAPLRYFSSLQMIAEENRLKDLGILHGVAQRAANGEGIDERFAKFGVNPLSEQGEARGSIEIFLDLLDAGKEMQAEAVAYWGQELGLSPDTVSKIQGMTRQDFISAAEGKRAYAVDETGYGLAQTAVDAIAAVDEWMSFRPSEVVREYIGVDLTESEASFLDTQPFDLGLMHVANLFGRLSDGTSALLEGYRSLMQENARFADENRQEFLNLHLDDEEMESALSAMAQAAGFGDERHRRGRLLPTREQLLPATIADSLTIAAPGVNSQSVSQEVQVHIDNIQVVTPAADAQGIANDLAGAVGQSLEHQLVNTASDGVNL